MTPRERFIDNAVMVLGTVAMMVLLIARYAL